MPYFYFPDETSNYGPSYSDFDRLKKRIQELEKATGHVPPPEPERVPGTIANIGAMLGKRYTEMFVNAAMKSAFTKKQGKKRK